MPQDARSSRPRLDDPDVRKVLLHLHEASACATEFGDSPWEFALNLRALCRLGADETTLRWLVRSGLALHALEITPRRAATRSFEAVKHLHFAAGCCFILTPEGSAIAESITTIEGAPLQSQLDVAPTTLKPCWLADRRELYLGQVLVKKYRVPAKNQITVLSAFEEEGWPYRIDNPIPPNGDNDATNRLAATVIRLNRRQRRRLLHFCGDGQGEGVCWQIARVAPGDR